uniref:RNA-directed RNA polymerase n=1 Tax=Colletotrichum cliviicola victorivirus 1 TaxID=3230497 RepID=A0AAU8EJ71_9VIRU
MDQRVGEFGPLGLYLRKVLEDSGIDLTPFTTADDSSLAILVESAIPRLRETHPALPAAVSLLALEFPLQLPDPSAQTEALLAALPALETVPHRRPPRRGANETLRQFEKRLRKSFPFKENAAARTKCSVELSRLFVSVSTNFSPAFVYSALSLPPDTSYDQAVASLLYACGLTPTLGNRSSKIASTLVGNPAIAKGLSNALKALGCNSTPLGALLTETNTLQGRGVGTIDLKEEAEYRCDAARVAKKVIKCPDDELRRHIRDIIASELKSVPEFEDTDTWWSRRWQWCVNGTQNSLSNAALKLDSKRWEHTHTRAYRKMAAEAIENDPTSEWDGVTLVSVSPKLEHGKTRAIFACDTLSYFAFARLLDPVQKVWANRRVLLDPGGRGMSFLARKINHGWSRGGVNLMLDYDDFNSQHTTRAMQLVFEELGSLTNYPSEALSSLVKSFDRTYIRVPGGGLERSQGTLMSGHRGTTFINSILNAAYIRWALGAQRFDAMDSLHTGDDVYILSDTLPDALNILRKCRAAGCRMNPSKQSLGRHSAEFLRCAIGKNGAFGYLARAIGSISCGSWMDPSPTVAYESLRNGMSVARSLINRSGFEPYGRILAQSWKDRTYAHCLEDLFSGRASLDGSPVFSNSEVVSTYTARNTATPPEDSFTPVGWGTYASRAYLERHVSPVESTALQMAKTDPLPMLVSLSHQRGLAEPKELGSGQVEIVSDSPVRPRGHAYAFELFAAPPKEGVLERFPLINLVSGRLNATQLRVLVGLAGGDATAPDIKAEAFGPSAVTHRVVGVMPYSDAAALSKKSDAGVIHASLNVAL